MAEFKTSLFVLSKFYINKTGLEKRKNARVFDYEITFIHFLIIDELNSIVNFWLKYITHKYLIYYVTRPVHSLFPKPQQIRVEPKSRLHLPLFLELNSNKTNENDRQNYPQMVAFGFYVYNSQLEINISKKN
ncbi:hypothetical protein BpHYR1_018566 [Brachionus plicatilis]|uniref:Uncharacterized protein n=1 Tax=Brachionus plicatilis TaxID=10195 RepID=A0A3M7QWA6_BRAPC|nr:hypothetical protein BpHYR1_018566 [Brachionus plicatilis]